jgi:diadenosine tetraphosphate (Ap4A) HIT family hydrolase
VPQTAVHEWVERCRAGGYAPAIGRLSSGWVVMGERQVLPGYCLLLPDPVVPHLNALSPAPRALFLAEMAQIGDALLAATQAVRINYAIFGNVEPALHAHLFPRSGNEPDHVRNAQPWALDWNAAPAYSDALHGDLKRRVESGLRDRGLL